MSAPTLAQWPGSSTPKSSPTAAGAWSSVEFAEFEFPGGYRTIPIPGPEVQDWPDAEHTDRDSDDTAAQLPSVTAAWRRVLALQSELGAPGPPATFEVADDPATAVWQLAALSPVGPFDRQGLLTAQNTASRLGLLAELLAGSEELIRARIEMG